MDLYIKVASSVKVPPFVPKTNVKIQISDNDPPPATDDPGAQPNTNILLTLTHPNW